MPQHHVALHVELICGQAVITDGNGGDPCAHSFHRCDQDTFCWLSHSGILRIDFPDGNPFDPGNQPPYTAAEGSCTGIVRVRPCAPVRTYAYTATVTPRESEAPVVLDPKVIIDDGRDGFIVADRLALDAAHGTAEAIFESLVARLSDAATGNADLSRLFAEKGVELSVSVKAGEHEIAIAVGRPKAGAPS